MMSKTGVSRPLSKDSIKTQTAAKATRPKIQTTIRIGSENKGLSNATGKSPVSRQKGRSVAEEEPAGETEGSSTGKAKRKSKNRDGTAKSDTAQTGVGRDSGKRDAGRLEMESRRRRVSSSESSPHGSGPPTPVDVPIRTVSSPMSTDSPEAVDGQLTAVSVDGRSTAASMALDSRCGSSFSTSTFGGGGLSRVPSIQRASQLSMQSTVELQIETPQPAKEEHTYRSEGVRKSLFQAARRCDFEAMSGILDEWKNIDISMTDESGKTLLHHCANSGDKMNVEILLKRGAPPNKVDKSGQTPLHYAAKKDYLDIIEMLAVHGAQLDFLEEKTGQTALHFAVAKNYVSTVQILMFSGADVGVKDKQGRTPLMLCRSKEMRTLLAMNGGQSAQGNSLGEIYIQTVEVLGGRKTFCDRLDVMFDFSECAVEEKISMMCRRQPLEYSDANFNLNDNEEIFSDVITYRLPRKGRATPTTIRLPIFGNPDANEELLLKSNLGHLVNVGSISEDNSRHYCHVTADLAKFDAFVIISRVRHEVFSVSAEGLTVTSAFDPKIQITIPPGSFDEPTEVKLETTNPPNPDIFERSDMKDVYSVTPFTRLYTDNNGGPKKEVQMKLPVPVEYGVGGSMRIFTSNVYQVDEINENSWTTLDTKLNVSKDSISFDMRSFSIKCGLETKKDVDPEKLRLQVHKLFLRARLREYTVGFISLSKQIGDSDSFRIVIECCHLETIDEQKIKWLSDGYEDQTQNISPCILKSKQNLKICLSKNFKNGSDADDTVLQFHPKRRNYVCLAVNVPQPAKQLVGNVQIYEVPLEFNKENTEESKEQKAKLLTKFSIELVKDVYCEPNVAIVTPTPDSRPDTVASRAPSVIRNRAPSSRGIDYSKEAKGDPSFKGFTNDAFLRELTDDMEDDWYKVVVLMGWSYGEVEKVTEDPGGSQQDKIWHFFLQWRNLNRTRDDLGMASLVTALSKGGRRDVCTTVQLKMRDWCAIESNRKSKFYRWVVKAFKDSDLMNPGDYPYPLSDQFLVLLVENTGAQFEVADALGVSKSDLQKIMDHSAIVEPEQKMLKIFLLVREKMTDKTEALRLLIGAFERTGIVSGKRWIVMACNKWLEDNGNTVDPFCEELASLLSAMSAY